MNHRTIFVQVVLKLFFILSTLSVLNCCAMALSQSQPRPSVHYAKFMEELPSMEGKTVVITGASKGLGYVTARSVVQKGASVFLLNRMSDKADKALAEIAKVSMENGAPPPQLVECDLLDFASVRNAAKQVQSQCGSNGIDVLCNNAGIMLQLDQASKDGYDITMSTNILSHFLLTKELIPEIEKAASIQGESKIVNMSSGSGFGPPSLNELYFQQRGGNLGGKEKSYERYHQSKLANLVFTSALNDRLKAKNSKVKAIACTPGVCATDMFVHATTVMQGQPAPLDMVPSVEDGCLAQLKCVCDPSVQSGDLWNPNMQGGEILARCDLKPPTVLVDEKAKSILWESCEKAVGSFKL